MTRPPRHEGQCSQAPPLHSLEAPARMEKQTHKSKLGNAKEHTRRRCPLFHVAKRLPDIRLVVLEA